MNKCPKCGNTNIYISKAKHKARCLKCGFTYDIENTNEISEISIKINEETTKLSNNKKSYYSKVNRFKNKGILLLVLASLFFIMNIILICFACTTKIFHSNVSLFVLSIIMLLICVVLSIFSINYAYSKKTSLSIQYKVYTCGIVSSLILSIISFSTCLASRISNSKYDGYINGMYYLFTPFQNTSFQIEKVDTDTITIPESIGGDTLKSVVIEETPLMQINNINLSVNVQYIDANSLCTFIPFGEYQKTLNIPYNSCLKKLSLNKSKINELKINHCSQLSKLVLQNCSQLKDLDFSNSVSLEELHLSNLPINSLNLHNIPLTAKFTIGCNEISNFIFPNNIKKLDSEHAFYNCFNSNYRLNIPSTVDSIKTNSINYCYMKEIHIPSSVTEIERDAINNCKNLTDIYCEAPSKPANWDVLWYSQCGNVNVHWGSSYES